MAGVNVFEPLANKVIDVANSWSGVAGSLTAAVLAPISVGVTILVMWHGVSILRGAGGGNHLLDIFVKCLRAFLVVAIGLTAGAYTANIVGFFQDLRSSLTGLFVNGAPTGYAAIDIAMQRMLDTWDPVWTWSNGHISFIEADASGIVAIACWGLMSAAFWVFGAICAINLIMIDVSLALVFALGPMAIASFAFQATARFTDAWIGAVLKYVLTAVVVAAVTGLGVGILEQYATRISNAGENMQFVVAALSALGSALVLGVLSMRIPALAADMVGGIGITAFGPSLGRAPIAALQSMVGRTGSAALNTAGYAAGHVAASGPGQQLASSSLGQLAVAAYGRTSGAAQTIGGSGGLGNAYLAGRSAGTGMVTGRPAGSAHTPGS